MMYPALRLGPTSAVMPGTTPGLIQGDSWVSDLFNAKNQSNQGARRKVAKVGESATLSAECTHPLFSNSLSTTNWQSSLVIGYIVSVLLRIHQMKSKFTRQNVLYVNQITSKFVTSTTATFLIWLVDLARRTNTDSAVSKLIAL
jgi:hypothetical protein